MKISIIDLSNEMSKWKVIGYSVAIIAMLYLGSALGKFSNLRYFRESIETIPVLVCLFFVLRLPKRHKVKMSLYLRIFLLIMPFLLIGFMDLKFIDKLLQQDAALMLWIVLEFSAIGISEELTFRFGLHRLWSQYSPTFFVVVNSLIFGILHYPSGIEQVIITGLLGVIFSLSRIAGMPIIVLIFWHGLVDGPGVMSVFGLVP